MGSFARDHRAHLQSEGDHVFVHPKWQKDVLRPGIHCAKIIVNYSSASIRFASPCEQQSASQKWRLCVEDDVDAQRQLCFCHNDGGRMYSVERQQLARTLPFRASRRVPLGLMGYPSALWFLYKATDFLRSLYLGR